MITNERAKTLLEGFQPMQEKPGEGPPFTCPRCGYRRMNEIAVRNAKSRQINVYICDQCGMDEALRDAAGLSPIPLNKWTMVQTFEISKDGGGNRDWLHTDDAPNQYVKRLSDTRYHLVQITPSVPNTDKCDVYSDIITITDYLKQDGSADEQLASVLATYGYNDVEHVKAEYGSAANQILCECLFESQWPGQGAKVSFTGARAECEGYVMDYIKRHDWRITNL